MGKVKQVFKGKTLTRTVVKNNILRIWGMTDETERHDWYKNANVLAKIIAGTMPAYNYQGKLTNMRKVVGIIAALSPLKTWEQNLVLAREFLKSGTCGHMGQFVQKATDILNSSGTDEDILDILNGRKITSFYLNIMYYESANYITIDRHALSVALGYWVTEEDYAGMTAAQYDFFVQCYCLAAAKVDVLPLRMQSATWVKWRKIKRDYKQ